MAADLPGGAPPEPIAFFNGAYRRESDCRVSIWDRGFLHGDVVFETMRVYRGFAFALDRHLARMNAGLAALGIPAPAVDWPQAVAGVVEVNGLGDEDAEARLTVSRGVRAARPGAAETPTVVATARPLSDRVRRAPDGLAAITLATPRTAHRFVMYKTGQFLECAVGLREAAARGADEGIFLDASGRYVEGCSSNFHAVAEGALWTAESGILPGVVRAIVLEIAAEIGLPARLGPVPAEIVRGAPELFLTNSLIEVTGLVRLDGRTIGGGKPGEVTRTLAEAYRRRVERARAA